MTLCHAARADARITCMVICIALTLSVAADAHDITHVIFFHPPPLVDCECIRVIETNCTIYESR